MNKFRKIWDEKKNNFLLENKELKIKECYHKFLQTFPEACDVTFRAFSNQRSRIGAISEKYKYIKKNNESRNAKPLFSEHEKKGYICIKINQPNEWMFKHHYIWWKNTGHKPITKKEMIIFLDGNNKNFDFKNLFLIPKAAAGIFNNPNLHLGVISGNPELTKINALNAILIYKTRKLGRKLGLVSNGNGGFKDDNAKKARERAKKKRIKK